MAADNYNKNMMALSLAQGIGALGSAYAQGSAAKLQYDFQAKQLEANSRLADIKGEDSIRRGKKEAGKAKQQAKQVIGAQRAAYAGQNVSVDEGVALAMQEETAAQGAENALAIENNAWREAWGFKAEALSGRSQAEFSRAAGSNIKNNTILTGGLSAINHGAQGYYYQNRKTPEVKETK